MKATIIRKLRRTTAAPTLGITNEANGVTQTMKDAIRLMRSVNPKASHQILRPKRCSPSDFQPSFE